MVYALHFDFAPSCQTSLLYSIVYPPLKQCYPNITCSDVFYESFVSNALIISSSWLPSLSLTCMYPSVAPNTGLHIQWIISLKISLLILALTLLWLWLKPSSSEFSLWGVHIAMHEPYHPAKFCRWTAWVGLMFHRAHLVRV